jgi:hypothetical protein
MKECNEQKMAISRLTEGLHADRVTLWRWVPRYAQKMESRLRKCSRRPRQLATGRDVRSGKGKGQVGKFVSGGGLRRSDDRLPATGQTL